MDIDDLIPEEPDVSLFGESTGLADVKLFVQGKHIPVIKTVLCVASPVFRAMIENDFKEKSGGEISLPGKKLDDVLTLLKCIYPDILLTITESVAFTVLPLSEEYQMTTLKTKCGDVLLQTFRQKFDDFYMKDCVYLYKYLTVSVKCDLERLKLYCVSLASDFKQRDLVNARQTYDIPVDVLRNVDMLAISKLETIRDDADSLIQSGDTLEDKIKCLCKHGVGVMRFNRSNQDILKQIIGNHMKASRLAYTYLKSNKDIQKLVVSRITEDKQTHYWCHDTEYNLLPEIIKRDIDDTMECVRKNDKFEF